MYPVVPLHFAPKRSTFFNWAYMEVECEESRAEKWVFFLFFLFFFIKTRIDMNLTIPYRTKVEFKTL